jgi:hypothetical protein
MCLVVGNTPVYLDKKEAIQELNCEVISSLMTPKRISWEVNRKSEPNHIYPVQVVLVELVRQHSHL